MAGRVRSALRSLLMRGLDAMRQQRQPMTVQQADSNEVEALCHDILNHLNCGDARVQAMVSLAEVYAWTGTPAQAMQAAEMWLRVALNADWLTGHYAAEKAGSLYRKAQSGDDRIEAIDWFIAQLASAEAGPIKCASARLVRIRALCWDKDFAGAAAAAMELDKELDSYVDLPGCEFVRAELLVRAAGFFTWAGDPETGAQLLDRVEMMGHGRYRTWVAAYRPTVDHALAP